MLPMFLFSATFFPLSVYPDWLEGVVQVTPLYHAVSLVRGLTTAQSASGRLPTTSTWRARQVGMLIAARRIEQLLLT